MTRVTLIHNPGAGGGGHARGEFLRLLSEAGYDVQYRSSKDDDYKQALKEPGELVIVAGGDGTIRKVAKRLVGSGAPLAVLPLGTANNIAMTLGIVGRGREWIEGLGSAQRVKFDVGRARGPWGKRRFFEAAGLGLFTAVMMALDARKEQEPGAFERIDDRLARDIRALQEALSDYPAHDLRLSIDGHDLSGRYLLVEAMNVRHIGPNLFLAPEADPGDGILDFVLLPEDQRGEFGDYLRDRLGGKQEAPSLTVRRGRRLEFAWDGTALRFDDQAWPKKEKKRWKLLKRKRERARRGEIDMVEISLEDGQIEFLIPRAVAPST